MIQTVEMYQYLRADRFQQWLEARSETEIVGKAGSACKCPLANYLSSVWTLEDGDRILVNQLVIHISNNNIDRQFHIPIPSWMNRFVYLIDQHDMFFQRDECLMFLEEVKQYD